MKLNFLLPMALGALVVFQGVMNRQIGEVKGLSFAVFMNAVVLVTVASTVLAGLFVWGQQAPDYLRPQLNPVWRWWYILPGLMGFMLVFNVPISMRGLGAFPTIVSMLLGQLLCSFIWDALAAGSFNITRLAGLILTALGTYLAVRP